MENMKTSTELIIIAFLLPLILWASLGVASRATRLGGILGAAVTEVQYVRGVK